MSDDRANPPGPFGAAPAAPPKLQAVGNLRQIPPPGEPAVDYNAIIERVFVEAARHERALAEERREAPALVTELEAQPPSRRLLLVRNSRRYQTWSVCQRLIDSSHRLAEDDPQQGRGLAELATEVADRLDVEHYGPAQVRDMKAAAWSQYANAQRVVSDLRQAEEAFGIAEHFLAGGSGDLLALARLFDLKASLRRAQRRFDDSEALLAAAIDLYRKLRDPRHEGAALIKLAGVKARQGDFAHAIDLVQLGIALLDPVAERRLINLARGNLVVYLADAGRFLEAQALLARARRAQAKEGERIALLRLRWVEGKIAAGLGQAAEAERAYTEARQGFIDHALGYDAALVSLELAELYARQGRTGEMKRLAVEMIPIFRSRDVHREAIAALLVLRQAIEAEAATAAVIGDVRTFLSQARDNPRLRFEGPPLPGPEPTRPPAPGSSG